MEWVKVASIGQVADGQIVPIEAGGNKLLLANVGGQLHAAQRKCPHLGFNLCRGSLEDNAVVCPLHKARFDLTTGKIERDPKLLFIKMTAKHDLKTWPVRIEGQDVLVGV